MGRQPARWLIVPFVLLATAAAAHSWYPADCCSGRDCFEVAPEDMIEVDAGWKYLPRNLVFPKDQIRPSQDAHFHVCIGTYEFNKDKPLCAFILQGA